MMRHRRIPAVVAGVLVAVSWAFAASACENHNKSTAANAVASSATKSATCTAEQMAACKAKGASAAVASNHCGSASKTSAVMASNGCAAHKSSSAASVAASSGCSGMLGAVFAVASNGSADHCGGAKSAKVASAKSGSAGCAVDKAAAYDAMSAGSGCSSHSSSRSAKNTMARGHHGDCDACADMLSCQEQLTSIGTQIQAVPLKNGVMLVYTASAPSGVRAVQATMNRRSDRLAVITASGDNASLCPECKSLRGAVANGKLNREIVNIEGGCLTLMTSNDPAMVARLQAMAGLQTARAKS